MKPFVIFLLLYSPLWVLAMDKRLDERNVRKPHIVFLISEDPLNYEAHVTVPPFADSLQRVGVAKTTVLKGNGTHAAYRFEGLDVLDQADLLVVFCRRVALPHDQMDRIQSYIKAGKPVLGIRTANHAFSIRGESPSPGFEGWWGFVPDILGCENKGYEPEELGTEVKPVAEQVGHPLLKGIDLGMPWHSKGSVYKVAPLVDDDAVVVLTASTENVIEPTTWTRRNAYGGQVFYTALGYPDDFNDVAFRTLLTNAIAWLIAE